MDTSGSRINYEQLKAYAPIVLRIAMALVFLWFGFNQVFNPVNFIGYLPGWMMGPSQPGTMGNMMAVMMGSQAGFSTAQASGFVIANGVFEIIFGLLLLSGIFTRIVALLLGLHLLFISLELGYGDLMIRDFGLAVATFAVALHGDDEFCIHDRLFKKSSA